MKVVAINFNTGLPQLDRNSTVTERKFSLVLNQYQTTSQAWMRNNLYFVKNH